MTIDVRGKRPFLVRFAEGIPPASPVRLAYDPSAQVSFVLLDGAWIPTLDQRNDVHGATKITGVEVETTDDD